MHDDAVAEFEHQRPRLFGLAYRLLGSAHDADDVVQEAFIRWDGVDRRAVVKPSAWLAKVVTNLALNRLTSARVQRECYVGPWLPEPVIAVDGVLGPLETVQQRESVSFAFMVLLERLTPAERAVFVLREAFAYRYREIAEIMATSEANCRQLHRRARGRLQEVRPRFGSDHQERSRLVERFLAAAREGDLSGLEQVLAADVSSWADGGGKVTTALRPVLGRQRVIRYFMGGMSRFASGLRLEMAEVNGEPAVLVSAGARTTWRGTRRPWPRRTGGCRDVAESRTGLPRRHPRAGRTGTTAVAARVLRQCPVGRDAAAVQRTPDA
ncbi:RNA polymerase subunit sigma-24 [Actinosynnema sp. ALI-1.44]|uniref:RNA polymerase sigma-70 factor n=1 Tax=Actinosynnema sp. ALI-1.44 TaxID=1933779 RepID=UPI00097BE58C|nr:RNA polymerase sigma-70 factor [Actinosynnema sp. ALI-1.44]ONI84204.1 RNA polymerase subunit sigma-24 [Actinosynnema sp. ALI-1.44]